MLNDKKIAYIEDLINKSKIIGIASDYKVRNLKIFLKFNKLRTEKRMSYDDAIGLLAKENYRATSTIQMIISKQNSRFDAIKEISSL